MEKESSRYIEEGDFCFFLKEKHSTGFITIMGRPKNSHNDWQPAADVLAQEARVTHVYDGWMNSPELFPVVSTICSLCATRRVA